MASFYVLTTVGPKGYNCVQVEVDHYKNQQAFIASAHAAERSVGGTRFELTDLLRSNMIILAPSKANYAKQRAIWEQTAKNQIELRQGHIWDLVLRVCEQFGLVPA